MRDRLSGILNFQLIESSDGGLTVSNVLVLLAIVVATYWLSRIVRRAVVEAFRRTGVDDREVIRVYGNLAAATVWFLGVTALVYRSGLNPTAVFAAGGFAAIAVGFATQDLINNLMSGAMLRLEGAIRAGDVLEVDHRIVKVRKMRTRATIARDLNEQDLVIPNSELAKRTVINFTLSDDLFRLRADVGVHYSSDMSHVRSVLEAVATDLSWRSMTPEPRVLLLAFGNSSVDWEVSVWIDDPWQQRVYRSQLNEAIWNGLQKAGIVIAFPQLDVHIATPAPAKPGED